MGAMRPPARPAADRFARRVAARHGRRGWIPCPLGLTLVHVGWPAMPGRARPAIGVSLGGMTFAPRIALTIMRPGGAPPLTAAGGSDPVAGPTARSTADTALAIETRVLMRGERLLERAVSRGTRIDLVGPGPAGASGTPPAVHRLPAPAVLAAPAPRGALAGAVGRSEAASAWDQGDVLRRTSTEVAAQAARYAHAAVEQLDVDRFTDRVIASIDRRIVAQRERLGRL